MVPRNAPFAALLLILISSLSTPDALPAQTAPAIESINQADLRADLFFLAGDEMRGRLAGSAENRMASAFIKSRFERFGASTGRLERLLLPVLQRRSDVGG